MNEFYYLVKKDDPKEKIIQRFWAISNTTERNNILEIIALCEQYPEKDALIEDIHCLSEVLLNMPKIPLTPVDDYSKKRIEKIWTRLNQMNLWTLNELKLASYCLFFFSSETRLFVAKRIRKELLEYLDFENIQVQIFIIHQYINLCTLYMVEKNFKDAKKSNSQAMMMAKEINRFDLYFFCQVREGIFCQNQEKKANGIRMLEKMDKEKLVDELELEIMNIVFTEK